MSYHNSLALLNLVYHCEPIGTEKTTLIIKKIKKLAYIDLWSWFLLLAERSSTQHKKRFSDKSSKLAAADLLYDGSGQLRSSVCLCLFLPNQSSPSIECINNNHVDWNHMDFLIAFWFRCNDSDEQDHTSMTIEFLRARLLAERAVSKSARAKLDGLADKVLSLSFLLICTIPSLSVIFMLWSLGGRAGGTAKDCVFTEKEGRTSNCWCPCHPCRKWV